LVIRLPCQRGLCVGFAGSSTADAAGLLCRLVSPSYIISDPSLERFLSAGGKVSQARGPGIKHDAFFRNPIGRSVIADRDGRGVENPDAFFQKLNNGLWKPVCVHRLYVSICFHVFLREAIFKTVRWAVRLPGYLPAGMKGLQGFGEFNPSLIIFFWKVFRLMPR